MTATVTVLAMLFGCSEGKIWLMCSYYGTFWSMITYVHVVFYRISQKSCSLKYCCTSLLWKGFSGLRICLPELIQTSWNEAWRALLPLPEGALQGGRTIIRPTTLAWTVSSWLRWIFSLIVVCFYIFNVSDKYLEVLTLVESRSYNKLGWQ